MATIELTASSIIAATGWTGATVDNLRLSDDARATGGDPGEIIHAELTNTTVDFSSQNSVVLRVEARVVGTVSRDKQLTVELLDSGDNLLESFTTAVLTASDVLYSSSTLTRSDSAAVIDGYRVRITVIEGTGMPDSATVEIDQIRFTLDYAQKAKYTDAFNRVNAQTLGSPWVEKENATNVFIIDTNEARLRGSSTGSLRGVAFYDNAFDNDQYSQATYRGPTTGVTTFHGPAVRVATTSTFDNATCYGIIVDDGATPDLRLYRWVGVDMTLAAGINIRTVAHTPVVGNVYFIQAVGTTIRVLVNGIERINETDANISTGKAGFEAPLVAGFTTQADWDDWEGGPQAAVAGGTPYYYNWRRRVA